VDERQLSLFAGDMLSTEKFQETLQTTQQGFWIADQDTNSTTIRKGHFQRDATWTVAKNRYLGTNQTM
jgi:hypothetical protein